MRVRVTKDTVKIVDDNYVVNKGEYNINKCEFEFAEEYTEDLIKKAIFVNGETKKEMAIINNECDIPQEVLNSNSFELRVYAYEVSEGELVLRYSPTYTYAYLREGSYMGGATPSERITPSQFQQYETALHEGLQDVNDELDLVEEKLQEAENLNIEGQKEGHTATITITDRYGTQTAINVYDGEKGDAGEPGPKGEQGVPGAPGEKGETGYYFTPTVNANGDLSWTNNGDLENPTTVNIKGPKGDVGPKGDTGVQGPQGLQGPKGDIGATGPQGPAGQDGVTPVKGVDYFTPADIAEIEGDIIPTIDFSNADEVLEIINEATDEDKSGIFVYATNIGENMDYNTYAYIEILSEASGKAYYGSNVASFSIETDDETGDSIIVYEEVETMATREYVDDAVASAGGGEQIPTLVLDNPYTFVSGRSVTDTTILNFFSTRITEMLTEAPKKGLILIEYNNSGKSELWCCTEDVSSQSTQYNFYLVNTEIKGANYRYALAVRGAWANDIFTCSYIMTVQDSYSFVFSNQVLTKTNNDSYTPTGNYHPATKKYVDDAISAAITTTLGGSY